MRLWLFLFSLIFVSAAFTWVLIWVARRHSILDVPNERSSHTVPTPRGGGAAIILTFVLGLIAIYLKDVVENPIFLALLSGGVLIAIVGLVDDKFGVSAKKRFTVHILAACIAVFLLRQVPELPFQEYFADLKYLGFVAAILAIVWSTNLFNFMDGINGLSGFEAAFISLSAAAILYSTGEEFHAASLLVLGFSTLGFLLFNFPHAKIFMGDVGSGFLGFLVAVYAIGVSSTDAISPWSWMILYGYFIVDSTVTLITRMLSGQKWLQAHNLHAYQKWSRKLASHSKVTISILAINLIWLFPLAWFATIYNDYAFWFCLTALLPLVVAVVLSQAGVREEV